MTNPQQPERFESTERTDSSAQNVDAPTASGSGLPYPAEGSAAAGYPPGGGRAPAENHPEGRDTARSSDTSHQGEGTGAPAHGYDQGRQSGSSSSAEGYPAEGYPAEGGRASAQHAEGAGAADSSYERPAADRTDPSMTQQVTEHRDTSTQAGAAAGSPTSGAESSAQHTGTGSGQSLFGEQEHSNLRARWADVQAAFVDDPRECVQKADRLVADLVDHLTAGFSQARSQLEDQWARGEEVSTENLRVALQRYRDFFERLLAVS